MQLRGLALVLLLVASLAAPASAARILAIFPHFGKSHFDFFEPLMKALAARGHDLHVLSYFPQKQPLANYTDHILEGSMLAPATGGVSLRARASENPVQQQLHLAYMGLSTCEAVLSHNTTQHLLRSDLHFDLLITELFNTDCFLGFVHRFKAPFIALSSCALMPWSNGRMGNPDNPAYIPNLFAPLGSKMSFWERTYNTGLYLLHQIIRKLLVDIPSQKVASHFFGSDLPPLQEIAKNTSLLLVNSYFTLHSVRPFVPGVIEVGGMHLPPAPKPLPQDIKEFLDGAIHGVIYFNMGSMIKASTLHEDKLHAYLEAFSSLPQRILWKWEEDTLPYQPENVMVKKWLPQFDILSHPSVKVFIGHGGLLGTIEAVYFGVPILGTPIFGDQKVNMHSLTDAGMAIKLDYADITKESLLHSLRELIYNSSYRENAKLRSELFRDRPQSPLETAVHWTEYIIRHKGASHMRSAAADLNFIQYLLLDVIFVVAMGLLTIAVVVGFILKKIIKKVQIFLILRKKLQ
ncbi:UDP-glycosyltransferase UGT5-like [Schistocerca americana]|uniref:UDP-glycosyltransferase UGT5-like n=1 Tax=Schistocerca americana TaxID=7009 RepID=UPI001F502EA7|nr:UDP-glycosyltransferase UGT5-like [Schistocerca americana]XP_046996865.1 UDP-glycosyltransferase UGT5-like [Schistocerca americana]